MSYWLAINDHFLWFGTTRSRFSLIGLCPRCFIGPSNLCRIGFHFIGPSKAARGEKPNKENAFQRPIDWYNKGYAFSKIINKSKEAKNHPISHPLLTVDVFT
ncbi:hypothetical protein T12_4241 [Trichinella patagoniensis]|uniref:Uncharacterized protein n=1 Tax=Trichinella patagoniensis TaxID=990121 RepID=A0A0V0Z5T5_9BILA|nr:hypothetical protein T12_4241 [Trichinella patagoniensis]